MTSLCDRCYSPGACCYDFFLPVYVDDHPTAEDALRRMTEAIHTEATDTAPAKLGLPFIPLRIKDDHWRFMCPVLKPDGRCGDYENRPITCRLFEAASDGLCVHFNGAENSERADA